MSKLRLGMCSTITARFNNEMNQIYLRSVSLWKPYHMEGAAIHNNNKRIKTTKYY